MDSDEPGQHSTRHSGWAVCSPEANERRGRVEGHDMQNWDSVSQLGGGRFGAASCSGSLDWRLHGFIPSSSILPIRLSAVPFAPRLWWAGVPGWSTPSSVMAVWRKQDGRRSALDVLSILLPMSSCTGMCAAGHATACNSWTLMAPRCL